MRRDPRDELRHGSRRLAGDEPPARHQDLTLNGAYASFEEGIKGSLEPGKLADLVVLDGTILSTPPEALLSLSPALTMIGGEVVFEHEGAAEPEDAARTAEPAR